MRMYRHDSMTCDTYIHIHVCIHVCIHVYVYVYIFMYIYVCIYSCIYIYVCIHVPLHDLRHMGWLQSVASIKLYVSFAKEPYKRDNILQKRPIILSILLTYGVATVTVVYIYIHVYI